MRINYNVAAMITNNNLANSDNLLSQSLQRLSSGLKINSAKDNPAGLAMAKRMNAQLIGLEMANQNASDGVSIIETADGAMAEISEMLQRLNELAIKAANGVLSDGMDADGVNAQGDRLVIQEEIDQLTAEINRVSEATEFNGQKLLNGEFSMKGFVQNKYDDGLYGTGMNMKVLQYSSQVAHREYKLSMEVTARKAPETGYDVKVNPKDGFPADATVTEKDNLLTIRGGVGFEMVLDLAECDLADKAKTGRSYDVTLDIAGIGGMRLQVGANEGQVVEINIPSVSTRNMGLDEVLEIKEYEWDANGNQVKGPDGKPRVKTKTVRMLDVRTKEKATEAIDRVDGALRFLSSVRGQLGAYQNRLESAINSLDITSEGMTAAYSRIMDVDMAEEMTNYTTYQVMTQAATSMLAQANERPSQVLQLLQ